MVVGAIGTGSRNTTELVGGGAVKRSSSSNVDARAPKISSLEIRVELAAGGSGLEQQHSGTTPMVTLDEADVAGEVSVDTDTVTSRLGHCVEHVAGATRAATESSHMDVAPTMESGATVVWMDVALLDVSFAAGACRSNREEVGVKAASPWS
jgi:hypothetical protein